MKAVVAGLGFLVGGLVADNMLDRFGIELPLWALILILAISIAMIVWGLTPRKVKDWPKEQVAIIWPTHIQYVGESKITRFLRWFKRH